ncbi:unnamed protein product [Orchesella dallaii]|uniref:Uncharacterized protein n=1 Tax=Orchesella dallaii TaxID=48710 RepID=A0ABP1QXS0_9HEXA
MRDEVDGTEKRERGWSYEEINMWSMWNFRDDGFIIQNSRFPHRQKRAGSLNGLSVLVDPDVSDGFCQSQDSQGFRILLHTPVDSPRIANMGTGFGLERETFVKVFPDLTVADKNILDYDLVSVTISE